MGNLIIFFCSLPSIIAFVFVVSACIASGKINSYEELKPKEERKVKKKFIKAKNILYSSR